MHSSVRLVDLVHVLNQHLLALLLLAEVLGSSPVGVSGLVDNCLLSGVSTLNLLALHQLWFQTLVGHESRTVALTS